MAKLGGPATSRYKCPKKGFTEARDELPIDWKKEKERKRPTGRYIGMRMKVPSLYHHEMTSDQTHMTLPRVLARPCLRQKNVQALVPTSRLPLHHSAERMFHRRWKHRRKSLCVLTTQVRLGRTRSRRSVHMIITDGSLDFGQKCFAAGYNESGALDKR